MSLRRPEAQRIGDDFLFTYPVGGIKVEMSSVSESRREGTHAMVVVRSNAGKLCWTRLKLDSDRERSSLAKTLASKNGTADFPWADALAQCAEMACEMYQAGEPTVLLWDVPAPMEPSYLLDPLLPLNETTTLYGDGDAGKSLVALRMALAVTSDAPMEGVKLASKPGAVMYLDWETNAETHARRIRRLAAAEGIVTAPRIHYRKIKRAVADEIRGLQYEIVKLGVVLVIVDSLGAAAGITYGDSINDPSVGAGVMNALRGLNATRLLIHHMTHDAVKNGGSTAPFGSRYFRNYSRCLWEMRRSPISEDVARIALFNRKMNDDARREQPVAYEIDYGGRGGPIRFHSVELADDAELIQHLPLVDQVVHYLERQHGAPMTTKDLCDRTGKDAGSLRRTLKGSPRVTELDSGQGRSGGTYWALAARSLREVGHE